MKTQTATVNRGSEDSRNRPWEPHVWCCPFCDHSLTYKEKDREVARLAARSHVIRRHPGSYWVNFSSKDLLLNTIST